MEEDPLCRCGHRWRIHFRMNPFHTRLYCTLENCKCRLFIHGGNEGPVVVDEEPAATVPPPPPNVTLDDTEVMFSLLEPYDAPR